VIHQSQRRYHRFKTGKTNKEWHADFVNNIFTSREEYKRYIREFEEGETARLWDEGLRQLRQLFDDDASYGVDIEYAKDYYAIVREMEPATVVETGVCNGISTLAILIAIKENKSGTLYSIDYPLRADESLDEFRSETFDGYGGAAIPSNKDPGWIIPEEIRSNWELIIGKSQRELPKIVSEINSFDIFIHDSEHSHPCMMFEFELAFEWINKEGVIVADDISWNTAFSTFTDVRDPAFGYISNNIGYIQMKD